ncbi:MAG: PIN domain-containing protein [Desulfuromonadales bacterium]
MTTGLVVVDTNVVVAALLTADAASPPARILDGMLGGNFLYLLSPALLAEYRRVLLRPAIRHRHGLNAEEVDLLLEELVAGAVWREPSGGLPAPDPGDDHLWALAGCHPGACLVTGDRLLLDNPPADVRVITPRQLLEHLG